MYHFFCIKSLFLNLNTKRDTFNTYFNVFSVFLCSTQFIVVCKLHCLQCLIDRDLVHKLPASFLRYGDKYHVDCPVCFSGLEYLN